MKGYIIMTDMKTEVLECPYCKEKLEKVTFDSIDLAKEPELKKLVMNEELFAMNCEKCGKTIYLNGVYTLDRAVKEHDEKEHTPKFARK